MRVIAALVFFAAAVLPVAAQNAGSASGNETAIREVVRQYVDAREKRDQRALEALFTADADQHTTAAEWRRGRDQVVRGSLASSENNQGTRQIIIEAVRLPAAGVAIADGRYEIRPRDGGEPRRMWTTFVLLRDGSSQWRITAIRNMLPTGGTR